MRMIKIPSTSLILASAALVMAAAGAFAQSGGSRAERLEWPRTFTGQPDFMFTRDEAIAEARIKAARENAPLPLTPGLQLLVEDDAELDPLAVKKPMVVDVSGTEDISGTEGDGEGVPSVANRQSLMDKLMAQAVDLPAVADSAEPDLSEFRSQLQATIRRTVANWQPDKNRYSFQSALNTLVLQAIVTSPVSYAVINQQRYEVGDTFRISVPLRVPQEAVIAALQAQMPVSGTLTPTLEASYQQVYDDVLDKFTAERNKEPEKAMQTLVLPVRVTAISRREVMLDLNGQPYALQIRYAY